MYEGFRVMLGEDPSRCRVESAEKSEPVLVVAGWSLDEHIKFRGFYTHISQFTNILFPIMQYFYEETINISLGFGG